ncbi:MAG: hypothetical protein CBC47_00865 [Alphaproteobacteria bacterium TMED87]|nr:hypothetical protein [Rhodospirillaceae bacterium]OUV11794.1 MAG: hypothetical protein CBC47_00865 [Alphaproteobacteria bacterium TMED87]
MFSLSLSELILIIFLAIFIFYALRKFTYIKKDISSSSEESVNECDLFKCPDCGEYYRTLSNHECRTSSF